MVMMSWSIGTIYIWDMGLDGLFWAFAWVNKTGGEHILLHGQLYTCNEMNDISASQLLIT
jgi:hypothetical protein